MIKKTREIFPTIRPFFFLPRRDHPLCLLIAAPIFLRGPLAFWCLAPYFLRPRSQVLITREKGNRMWELNHKNKLNDLPNGATRNFQASVYCRLNVGRISWCDVAGFIYLASTYANDLRGLNSWINIAEGSGVIKWLMRASFCVLNTHLVHIKPLCLTVNNGENLLDFGGSESLLGTLLLSSL